MRRHLTPALIVQLIIVLAAACGDGSADPDGGRPNGDGGVPPDGDGGVPPDGDGGLPPTGDGGVGDDGGGGGGPDAAPMLVVTVCTAGGADFTTIQAAIDDAPPGYRIEICPGTYFERLTIDRTLVLAAAPGGDVIVDGSGDGTTLVIGDLIDEIVTIEGITFRNGRPSGVRCEGSGQLILHDVAIIDSQGQLGGGLYVNGCDVDITGGRVSGNTSTDKGGGIYLAGGGVVDGLLIEGNHSTNKGGAFYVAGTSPTLRNLTVRGNTSLEDGGGLFLHYSSSLVELSLFENNESINDDGGGLRLLVSTAIVRNNVFRGNRSLGDGGALKVSHADSEFTDNLFEDNVSALVGGAMEMDDTQSLIANSTFRRNQARRGGAIHGAFIGTGAVWRDSLLEDNVATDKGGAIFVENNEGGVIMRRLVIRRNSADRGGGVGATGTWFVITNSILEDNFADGSGGGVYLGANSLGTLEYVVLTGNSASSASQIRITDSASVTVRSSALINGGDDSIVMASPESLLPNVWEFNNIWPTGEFVGLADPTGSSGNITADPIFFDAATGDYRPAAGSPLIDAGNTAVFDLDGSRSDIGAFGGPEAF